MIEKLFVESPLWLVYAATVFYFVLLYFGFALLGEFLSKHFLPQKGIGISLSKEENEPKQKRKEIRYSLVSIAVFGFFGILPRIFYDLGFVSIKWDINWKVLPLELIAVFLWNDLHFYCCHWLLHRKYFFKKVHYIHHQSYSPTAYSTYSFHWVEALLLSTVMIIPMFIYDFCYLTLLLLPAMSIFINTLGHWNYDLFPDKKNKIYKFSSHHSLHHTKVRGNYGFFLSVFDELFGTELKENEKFSKN